MSEEKLGIIVERLDNLKTQNEEEHKRIEEQVKRTNGAVANLKLWRAYLTGAIAILSAIIVPILFMLLSKWLDK